MQSPPPSSTPPKLAMHLSTRCGARTRSANVCQSPAMPNGRCRMHGGKSPGAPAGNERTRKHGLYGREMHAVRAHVRELGRLPDGTLIRTVKWPGTHRRIRYLRDP